MMPAGLTMLLALSVVVARPLTTRDHPDAPSVPVSEANMDAGMPVLSHGKMEAGVVAPPVQDTQPMAANSTPGNHHEEQETPSEHHASQDPDPLNAHQVAIEPNPKGPGNSMMDYIGTNNLDAVHKDSGNHLKLNLPSIGLNMSQPVSLPMHDIAIVIPTVRRFQSDHSPAPERYLVPMVNKLWTELSTEEKQHVHFFILNSDREPEKHEEAESLREHPGVTLLTKMQAKEEIVNSVAQYTTLEDGREVSSEWMSWVASENVDGSYLFEKAKDTKPYVLFLEDDIWPTTNALRKLSHFLYDFEGSHTNDWLFLDLYTPNLDWAPGMLDVHNGEAYAFECCTQAMLFPSDKLDGVISYWRAHPREPVDDNLRIYLRDLHPELSVYAVRPNLFQHVGAYSSNPQKSTGVVEHESIDFVPLLIQVGEQRVERST